MIFDTATKTPEEVIKWCNMMLNLHPNVEDANFFKSIKWYMQSEILRTDLATKCTAYLDEFREEKKMTPKTSHWEDSSNGWTCYACKRDSSSAYKICPNCKRKMRNGYVEIKENEE